MYYLSKNLKEIQNGSFNKKKKKKICSLILSTANIFVFTIAVLPLGQCLDVIKPKASEILGLKFVTSVILNKLVLGKPFVCFSVFCKNTP